MHTSYLLYATDLPPDCIAECSASGDVSAEVDYWREELAFTVERPNAIECLAGYGAWDRDELAAVPDETLAERILWLACCDFKEGDSSFVLE